MVRATWSRWVCHGTLPRVEAPFIAKFRSMQYLADNAPTVVESRRCISSKAIVKKSVAQLTLVASLASATLHAQDAIVPLHAVDIVIE